MDPAIFCPWCTSQVQDDGYAWDCQDRICDDCGNRGKAFEAWREFVIFYTTTEAIE